MKRWLLAIALLATVLSAVGCAKKEDNATDNSGSTPVDNSSPVGGNPATPPTGRN